MRLIPYRVLVALVTLLLPTAPAASVETPLVPRKALFADPDKEQVQLSPDGLMIGYRAASGGVTNVWVTSAREPGKAAPVTRLKDVPVLGYRWTYLPGQIVYTAPVGKGVHVFLLDPKAREPRDLTLID